MFGADVATPARRLRLTQDSSRTLTGLFQMYGRNLEKVALPCVLGIPLAVRPGRCDEPNTESARAEASRRIRGAGANGISRDRTTRADLEAVATGCASESRRPRR